MDYEIEMADIAAGQWGLITSRQALDAGATSNALTRLTARGALERVTHGVYRIGGTPPSSLDGLRADWLALDPAVHASDRRWNGLELGEPLAVVSHRSAARLHDLGDIDADDHEFTLPVRKQTRRDSVKLHRFPLGERDWTLVEGLPVTTPVRTIDDLAAAHIDGGHLASIVRDAITSGSADDDEIVRVLRRHARFYGAPMGNGEELLKFFLQEAGVPKATTRLAAAASGSDWSGARVAEITAPAIREALAHTLSVNLGSDIQASIAKALSARLGGDVEATLREALANTLVHASLSETLLERNREALKPLLDTALRNNVALNEISQSLGKVLKASAAIPDIDILRALEGASQQTTDEQRHKETMDDSTPAIAAPMQDSTDVAAETNGGTEGEE